MLAIIQKPLSVEEYLDGEAHSQTRHEYLNGAVYAMSGASVVHNLIAGNLFALLHSHLRGGPCQVFMSDVKLRFSTARDTRFYYPDLQVCCQPNDRAELFRTQPVLLAEVTSKSTERTDRFEKFEVYREISSLQEYLLIAQDLQKVEIFRRRSDWQGEKYLLGEQVMLEAVDLTVALAAIYQGV